MHTAWGFSVADSATSNGESCNCQNQQWSNENAADHRPVGRRFDSRSADYQRRQLTPPPPLPPTPTHPSQKSDIQFQGIEASESKNPLGDRLIGQNNDVTRGWTSNIMPWGMLRERPPKRGGIQRPRLRLI